MAIGAPPQVSAAEPEQWVSGQIPSPDAPIRWSLGLRWLFRFGFAYFTLICIDILSTLEELIRYFVTHNLRGGFLDPVWKRVMPWISTHVFHLGPSAFSTNRGDLIHDGSFLAFNLGVAAVATVVWSLLDRKRPNYRKLHVWLRILVRFCLATMMFAYGMDKVFPLQFGSVSLTRVTETVGNLSPEAMLWMFMAASVSYTVFGGLVEVAGGVLLLFPRLTSLGALVCIGAMANVFMLNMAYNVPVKLGAFRYLVMAAFLVVPEIHRLSNVFLFNRPAQPLMYPPVFRDKRLNRAVLMAPTVLGLVILAVFAFATAKNYQQRLKMEAVRPALYGIWTVDAFTPTGNSQPPLFTGDARWHRLIFQTPKQLMIQPMEGRAVGAALTMDAKDNTFALKGPGNTRNPAKWKADFKFETPQPNLLNLQGTIDGRPVEVKLHRMDETKYPLTSTGFHWINEYSR